MTTVEPQHAAGEPDRSAGERPAAVPDATVFRRLMGRFTTGVIVVTAQVDGADHAMTANAFSSVSLDPLLVLFCVQQDSRFHDTLAATDTWAVSVLDRAARRHAAWFADPTRPLTGQFERIPHHRSPAGLALLDDALVWLECRTSDRHPAGDHDIVVGSVQWLDAPDRLGDPLLWFASQYRGLSGTEPA